MSWQEALPEWNEAGTEPPQSKKNEGWEPEEKPPAGWFNWLFNRVYKALQEIRQKLDAHKANYTAEDPPHEYEDVSDDPNWDGVRYKLVVEEGQMYLEVTES